MENITITNEELRKIKPEIIICSYTCEKFSKKLVLVVDIDDDSILYRTYINNIILEHNRNTFEACNSYNYIKEETIKLILSEIE